MASIVQPPSVSTRVAIVSFVEAKNHGAYLQAYALQRFLENLGFESELIDYSNPHMARVYSPFHWEGLRGRNFLEILATIRLAIHDWRRNALFADFASRNLRLSSGSRQPAPSRTPGHYTSLMQLEESNAQYDAFLVGSDQVFSIRCSNFDTAYFLSFVRDRAKKFSYAASFGFDEIPLPYRDLYRVLLSSFSCLSVRERSGVDIVHRLMGDAAPPTEVHVDPTLLLDAEAWGEVAAQSRRSAPRKYLLLYNVYRPIRLFEAAFRVARERGLSLVYLGHDLPIRDRLRRGVRTIETAAPEDFVRFFRDAACVFTNSFHGTVFSVLFRKPFVVELDNENAFNHRAEDLLAKFHLGGQILSEYVSSTLDAPVPWDDVEQAMKTERIRSADYLRHILAPAAAPRTNPCK